MISDLHIQCANNARFAVSVVQNLFYHVGCRCLAVCPGNSDQFQSRGISKKAFARIGRILLVSGTVICVTFPGSPGAPFSHNGNSAVTYRLPGIVMTVHVKAWNTDEQAARPDLFESVSRFVISTEVAVIVLRISRSVSDFRIMSSSSSRDVIKIPGSGGSDI